MSDVVVNLVLNDKQFRQFLKQNETLAKNTSEKVASSIKKASDKTIVSLAGIAAAYKLIEKAGKFAIQTMERFFKIGVDLVKLGMPKEFDRLAKAGENLEKALAKSVNRSGALQTGLNALTTAAESLVKVFSSEAGGKVVNDFFRSFSGLVGQSINAVLGLVKLTGSIGKTVQRADVTRDKVFGSGLLEAPVNFLFGPAFMAGAALGRKPDDPSMPMLGPETEADFVKRTSLEALENLANELMGVSRGGKGSGLKPFTGIRPDKTKAQKLFPTMFGGIGSSDLEKMFGAALFGGLGAPQPDLGGELEREFQIEQQMEALLKRGSGGVESRRGRNREMTDALNAPLQAVMDLFEPTRNGLQGLRDIFVDGLTEMTDAAMPIVETLRGTLTDSFTGLFTGIAEGISEGTLDVVAEMGKFLGGLLKSVGGTLIQLGSAGLAAATLGTLIPVLAPATGGPAGIGASLAAIAAGGVLTAAGAALGGIGGGGPSAASVPASRAFVPGSGGTPGGGSSGRATGVPVAGLAGAGAGNIVNNFSINFNDKVIGTGDDERLGRFLWDQISPRLRRR